MRKLKNAIDDFWKSAYVFLLNLDFKALIFMILFGIILLFTLGFLLDLLYKDKYRVKKKYYRTLNSSLGGGEEYYYKYWMWQRQKKKYLEKVLNEQMGITRTYSRHAMKKRKYVKSITPFRREIYGVAK